VSPDGLAPIMPRIESRFLLMEHIDASGVDLFCVACERDLEGLVGKWARESDVSDGRSTSWVKIKNRNYTQIAERHELFERQAGGR
jgi:ATP-dependent DNA ligase